MARYQYETSPRKLEPEYEPKKKKRQKVNVQKNDQIKKQEEQKKQENLQRKRRQRIVLLLLATFAVLFVISYRNSLINENFAKVKSLKEELALVEKENEQLQVNIESSTNFCNFEIRKPIFFAVFFCSKFTSGFPICIRSIFNFRHS